MSVRVVMVDDHLLFRDLLRAFLHGRGGIEVVGQSSGGNDAMTMIQAARPDVVLMDVALRGGDGILATRELVGQEPRARVLMLSMLEDEHNVARALAAGARGYVYKLQSGDEVVAAIQAVYRGETYLPPSVDRAAVESLRRTHARNRQMGVLAPLSVRERDVFRLLVKGLGNDAIASALHIAESTVETHRARIIKRLRVHTLAGLVRFAAEHQLLHA